MEPFRDILELDRIHVFDGAMGTMLYSKGIYINRSYDELNLVAPDLVRDVHTEYVRAGADIIETNTYSATANKLQPYGLEGSLREINIAAARIAREAAGNRAYVAGAVGPLGLRIEPYGPTSFDEAKEMFTAQISALLEGGVDLFVLETFADLSELHQAIRAVRELCDLPIVAQMTIQVDGNTVFGATPESFTTQLDEWGADVIGLNCGVGPAPGYNSQALGPAERRLAPRCAGSAVLHVLARVHGGILPTHHPGGRTICGRMLWNHSGAYQMDCRRRSSV